MTVRNHVASSGNLFLIVILCSSVNFSAVEDLTDRFFNYVSGLWMKYITISVSNHRVVLNTLLVLTLCLLAKWVIDWFAKPVFSAKTMALLILILIAAMVLIYLFWPINRHMYIRRSHLYNKRRMVPTPAPEEMICFDPPWVEGSGLVNYLPPLNLALCAALKAHAAIAHKYRPPVNSGQSSTTDNITPTLDNLTSADIAASNSQYNSNHRTSPSQFGRVSLSRPPLRLEVGSCVIPHDAKAKTGGEDAFFVSKDRRVLGIADGVSSMATYGIDPKLFSTRLMESCNTFAENVCSANPSKSAEAARETTNNFLSSLDSSHPMYVHADTTNNSASHTSQNSANSGKKPSTQNFMEKAKNLWTDVSALAANILRCGYGSILRSEINGASTAVVCVLDEESQKLGFCSLGDSAVIVLRKVNSLAYHVVGKSLDLQHRFNCPFQLSFMEGQVGDSVDASDINTIPIEEGDLIILGTDGILDNVSVEEIAAIASRTVSPPEAHFIRKFHQRVGDLCDRAMKTNYSSASSSAASNGNPTNIINNESNNNHNSSSSSNNNNNSNNTNNINGTNNSNAANKLNRKKPSISYPFIDEVGDNHEIFSDSSLSTTQKLKNVSSTTPYMLAEALARFAYWRSKRKDIFTPFEDRCVKENLAWRGGKPDDITVLVAWVVGPKTPISPSTAVAVEPPKMTTFKNPTAEKSQNVLEAIRMQRSLALQQVQHHNQPRLNGNQTNINISSVASSLTPDQSLNRITSSASSIENTDHKISLRRGITSFKPVPHPDANDIESSPPLPSDIDDSAAANSFAESGTEINVGVQTKDKEIFADIKNSSNEKLNSSSSSLDEEEFKSISAELEIKVPVVYSGQEKHDIPSQNERKSPTRGSTFSTISFSLSDNSEINSPFDMEYPLPILFNDTSRIGFTDNNITSSNRTQDKSNSGVTQTHEESGEEDDISLDEREEVEELCLPEGVCPEDPQVCDDVSLKEESLLISGSHHGISLHLHPQHVRKPSSGAGSIRSRVEDCGMDVAASLMQQHAAGDLSSSHLEFNANEDDIQKNSE